MVWSALQAYRRTEADFADALIVCKAEKLAAEGDELSAVYTFDDVALQLPGTAMPYYISDSLPIPLTPPPPQSQLGSGLTP